MEVTAAISRRRMRRSFSNEPLEPATIDALCDIARRAPSAGNSQGTDLVVLQGPSETSRYWNATLTPERRESFAWPDLLNAPVLIVVVADPGAYVRRYSEADKAHTDLGESMNAWRVPFWFVDAGMVVENLLLCAHDQGLGGCFFGIFDHAPSVIDALNIPAAHEPVGTIALGYPTENDPPGRSASRPRRSADEVIHRGCW